MTAWQHDDANSTYTYDPRDLLTRASTTPTVGPSTSAKVTTFRYDTRGLLDRQVKDNGNTVTFDYLADLLLRSQTETTSGGAQVYRHNYAYDPNGNLARDESTKQKPGAPGTTLSTDYDYTYDPRDRVRRVVKAGTGAGTETYAYDGNDNVSSQTVGGVTTTFGYDRNRLETATASPGGARTSYGYDGFGRQTVASTTGAAVSTERWSYDGFDRMSRYRKGGASTTYDYDPLDRVRAKSVNPATGATKNSTMDYLGLSPAVLTERVDREVRKTYQYSPFGELLSQVVKTDSGRSESSFFSFNGRGDVDGITDENGRNRSTYAYSAYGAEDPAGTAGADTGAGAAGDGVGAEPYNAFRFGTGRLDASSGTYQYGARAYAPGVGRFLSMDVYGGALADVGLTSSPFTSNRYAFAAGNPINMLDATGHMPSFSSIGHFTLDVAGLVPVVGEAADVANGLWYTAQGNEIEAGLSFASAIPIAGYGASAVKAGKYADKAYGAVKSSDEVAAGAKRGYEALGTGRNGLRAGGNPKVSPTELKRESAMANRGPSAGGSGPPKAAGGGGAPAKAPSQTVLPAPAAAATAAESGQYLYRGVHSTHPGFEDALEGVARPRGGPATAYEHNALDDTRSEFTSWTTNPEVAEGFQGGSGVILRIPHSHGPGYSLVESPDVFDESEVLVRGVVTGAERWR